jgi:DNA repair protein RadA/Sms
VETVKDVGKQKTENGRQQRPASNSKPVKLSEVKHIEKNRLKSGFEEFDRVMGGGIVPGSVTLLTGDPGIGKSTLLIHVLAKIGGLYVSGEESAEQIKLRAKRLGINGDNISILAETNLESIIAAIATQNNNQPENQKPAASAIPSPVHPPLIIIDSIQTLSSEELAGMSGSVGQVRYCAEELVHSAKAQGVPVIIIGHVTKEGTVAGPKTLEHMVDTVLYLEGERFASARILRTLKNRFGAVEEVGIFDMREEGLKEVTNPSELFLSDRVKNVPGSVVTVVLEGSRPILVEIQALTVPSQLAIPRRVANGFDVNRLQMLTAIIQKRLNVPLGTFDIFVNVSGGLRIGEPSADLAVIMAILSSFKNSVVPDKTVIFGEVGLLGEVRRVVNEERREKEAKRMGYVRIISQASGRSIRENLKILVV